MNEDERQRLERYLLACAECSGPESGRLELRFPGTDWLNPLLIDSGGELSAEGRWVFESVSALDLLGSVFDVSDGASALRELYARWRLHDGRSVGALDVTLLRDDAVPPSKSRVSDSGYDLTLIHLARRIGQIYLFGTGVVVSPPEGWYFDVIARSSIIKTGYLLANSVGVIDRGYRGEVLVPLLQVDPDAQPISLPARLVQLVPRPIVHFPVRIKARHLETARSDGGFGSTGG